MPCGRTTLPNVTFVSLRTATTEKGEVVITYAGHSTYIIETPGGVTIATDFSGVYTAGKSPDVADDESRALDAFHTQS